MTEAYMRDSAQLAPLVKFVRTYVRTYFRTYVRTYVRWKLRACVRTYVGDLAPLTQRGTFTRAGVGDLAHSRDRAQLAHLAHLADPTHVRTYVISVHIFPRSRTFLKFNYVRTSYVLTCARAYVHMRPAALGTRTYVRMYGRTCVGVLTFQLRASLAQPQRVRRSPEISPIMYVRTYVRA